MSKTIKMKKLICLSIITVLLVACNQSQEQKAEVLIKESLKTTLYKPETYKPIETKVDSAFAPYDDPAFYEELSELVKMGEELEKLDKKAKQAKKSMSIWGGPYQTALSKINYQEAKEEQKKAHMSLKHQELSNELDEYLRIGEELSKTKGLEKKSLGDDKD